MNRHSRLDPVSRSSLFFFSISITLKLHLYLPYTSVLSPVGKKPNHVLGRGTVRVHLIPLVPEQKKIGRTY